MKKILKFIFALLIFGVLTLLTQVGGVAYIASLILAQKIKRPLPFKSSFFFVLTYLTLTFLIVPYFAPKFGREKVTHSQNIQPTNYATVLLNRNYVRPKVNSVLLKSAKKIKKQGIQIHYLDANFPFINKFPLLPHLSHNDGKKIDLSLIYEDKNGKISTKQKSRSGYGVFEEPFSKEGNQIDFCKSKGYFQYDYPKYLTFGSINNELHFSATGTKTLINELLQNTELEKIFIEPHLKSRLNLSDSRIRYHGCRAVRHDDHIHIQIK